jgi:hypothetical protein
MTIFSIPLIVSLLLTPSAVQSNQSLYTSVAPKDCRSTKSASQEGDSYEGRCRGASGYSLIVEEGDLRTNVKVVTPRGQQHSLELWNVVSGGFSSLGPKAEWRMTRRAGKLVPVGLILRFNASENPSEPNKITSYLVVTKITTDGICVTEKILPGPNANADARRAADGAASKDCLKTQ